MKTSPSSLKVRQIITQLKEGKLIPRPEFQRRLVWTSVDKQRFIDTVLKAYPFPEIYLANGEVDVDSGEGTQLIVDGQQRVATLASYFAGDPTTSNTPYATLQKEEKEAFLNYDVAVRDLGTVSPAEIVEVFKRINATKYSLNDIEINNAVYAGELMRYAQQLAEHEFFETYKVFRASDIKRMGDVRFALQLIITLMTGYFNRDDPFEEFLQRFNDTFPDRAAIDDRIQAAMGYVSECGFPAYSRIWKKTDLFTALVEVDGLLKDPAYNMSPSVVVPRLEEFYEAVSEDGLESGDFAVALYARAAVQASNDRINRLRRGVILRAVMIGEDPVEAVEREIG